MADAEDLRRMGTARTQQEQWAWEAGEDPIFDECYWCGEVVELDEVGELDGECPYCGEEFRSSGL
jgi:hypothetical protein